MLSILKIKAHDVNDDFNVVQDCCEQATRKIKNRNRRTRPRQPWMTSALISSTRQKSEAYKNIGNTRRTKRYKRTLNSYLPKLDRNARKVQTRYFGGLLGEFGDDPKKH